MKNILKSLSYSFFFLFFISCLPKKGTLRPHIIFKVYDFKSKVPLQGVKVIIGKESIDQVILSNKKGLIDIPKKEISYGNYHVLPLIETNFILNKENYIADSLSYVKYFKLNNKSKRDITYISDSIFLVRK